MTDHDRKAHKLDLAEGVIEGDDAIALITKALPMIAEMQLSANVPGRDWHVRVATARSLIAGVRDEMRAVAEERNA